MGANRRGAVTWLMPALGSLTVMLPKDHHRNRLTDTDTDAVPPLVPGRVPNPPIDAMPAPSVAT